MRTAFCLGWVLAFSLFLLPAGAQENAGNQVVFSNVRVFDGVSGQLSTPVNVYIKGNKIESINAASIAVKGEVVRINGKGKMLMSGLIDVHVHLSNTMCSTKSVD